MDEVDDRNVKKDSQLHQRKLSEKCSAEDTSFPCPDNLFPTECLFDEEELPESTLQSVHQSYPNSLSLPIPTKLASAMKGSRAEQGRIFEKLSVKWASDVYDPPQTSLSHTVNSKKEKKKPKNKKNGKKAQSQNNKNRRKVGENKTQIEKVGGNSGKRDNPVSFDEFKKCNAGSSDTYSGSRTALVSC